MTDVLSEEEMGAIMDRHALDLRTSSQQYKDRAALLAHIRALPIPPQKVSEEAFGVQPRSHRLSEDETQEVTEEMVKAALCEFYDCDNKRWGDDDKRRMCAALSAKEKKSG